MEVLHSMYFFAGIQEVISELLSAQGLADMEVLDGVSLECGNKQMQIQSTN